MATEPSDDLSQHPTTAAWGGGRLVANRYRLDEPIGEGAMGVVWRARDEEMNGRRVAIKVLPEAMRRDAKGLRQLRREAETAIGLRHPRIAGIQHLEVGADGVFLVMEYVDGPSLQQRLDEVETLSPADAITLAAPLCDALAYAHARGVIHRDVKPANILLAADGPKLADFGIAVPVRETLQRLSRPGTVGTLPYMAPEQIRGQSLTARTDIYQLAATLYECLSGRPPFHQGAIEWQIVNEAPPPLTGVPEPLASAVMRGLAKDPAQRPQTTEEFAALLRTAPGPTPAEIEVNVALQEVEKPARVVTPTPTVTTPRKTSALGATPAAVDPSEMILIPAGEFWMGSAEDDAEASDDEKPRHQVFVDVFEIDKDPVTNARWQRFMDAGGYRERGWWAADGWAWREENDVTQSDSREDGDFNAPDQPVVGVSWYEAEAFCRWAGKRLPTEAEWEKAARGTDGRKYPWGNEWDPARANSVESKIGKTTPVGKYPKGASPYGVRDLAGNVWEWVADWYDGDYYKRRPKRNPKGPDTGEERVLRGGQWSLNPIDLRAALRLSLTPADRSAGLGFRCARGFS